MGRMLPKLNTNDEVKKTIKMLKAEGDLYKIVHNRTSGTLLVTIPTMPELGTVVRGIQKWHCKGPWVISYHSDVFTGLE